MGGSALYPSSSQAGSNGRLAGLLSAADDVVRCVPCLSSSGPSAREAADGAVYNEPREALVGLSGSSAAVHTAG